MRAAPALFLVNELVGEQTDRQRQEEDPAGSGPGVESAQQEIGGEESAEKEDERSNDEPDCFSKPPGPSCTDPILINPDRRHAPTEELMGWLDGTCASRQTLHTRGRTFRNLVLPLARQL